MEFVHSMTPPVWTAKMGNPKIAVLPLSNKADLKKDQSQLSPAPRRRWLRAAADAAAAACPHGTSPSSGSPRSVHRRLRDATAWRSQFGGGREWASGGQLGGQNDAFHRSHWKGLGEVKTRHLAEPESTPRQICRLWKTSSFRVYEYEPFGR